MAISPLPPDSPRHAIEAIASPGPLLAELEQCLAEQIEAHDDLAHLLDEERRALSGLDITAIHDFARRKMEIGQRIAVAEARRRQACEALAVTLSESTGETLASPCRLSDIVALAPDSHRPLLADLRSRLVAAVERSGAGQSRNRTLCERFLAIMARSMESVQQAAASLPLYTTTAKVGQARWRGVVLSQTA